MLNDTLNIILKSKTWIELVLALENFGNAPEHKKIKGDVFEQLTKYYLKTDSLYSSMFENVWHHSEIPINVRDELRLPFPEIGVDLIAKHFDGSYCAIQCKFHQDAEQNVSYDELSTFFSVTERKGTYEKLFYRLVCSSANEISKRVKQLHSEKLGFLCSSEFQKLDKIAFNSIHRLIQGKKNKFTPYSPRAHQLMAIEKTRTYFSTSSKNKGKIIHPCGSGKSLTAYWIAKDLKATSVLIAVPSLALVKQTLSAWTREAIANQTKMEWVAVCSDQDVSINDDPSYQSHDLGIAVTTDVTSVANFLLQSTESMKVVITTYQSGEVISAAANLINYDFDLVIFDEAHKTAGHKSKKFSHLINDENVTTKKKVFMTATERQFRGDSTDFLSMDDKSIYGDVIDQLSFKKALEQKPQILCDYKIITVAVTKKEIEEVVINNDLTTVKGGNYSFENDGSTIAALISLRKLTREKNIQHAISFHSSIKRAEQFRDINKQINQKSKCLGILNAYHVSGKKSTGERHAEINRFLTNAPSVIANARCLTEGIDIPAVDAVVFSDPKQSVVDIVQAAGRAMRTHENKELGYIVIPVILNGGHEDTVQDAFRQLITVIAALGINDDRIIEEAKQYVSATVKNAGRILEFMRYASTAEVDFVDLVNGLEIKIWDRLSFAKSVIGESKFATWMSEHTTLSPKTVKNYNQAVRKISNDLVKFKLAYSSLEDITEQADLKQLKTEYFSIEEYKELDVRGKGMYSAAFNRLIEYQEFLRKNLPEN
jgi:predicted helicase